MSEPSEYASKASLLRGIAEFVYGSSHRRETVTIDDVYKAFPHEKGFAIDYALKRMDSFELISLELKGPVVRPLGHGKTCFEQNCVPEIILGLDYVAKKYKAAVVHIIVSGPNGEESGGTGFFWADYPNRVITAGHVVDGRTLKRIEDGEGNVMPITDNGVRSASDDLDLATLECDMPDGVEPIRVEWRPDAVSLGAELIVFGYPKISFHHPSLYQSRGQLHSIPRKYSSRKSFIVSGTHPGCSGGPVLDTRGLAIGVIEQENVIEHSAGSDAYISATPTYYLKELVPHPL